jgi:biotin carboxyl carrier protein
MEAIKMTNLVCAGRDGLMAHVHLKHGNAGQATTLLLDLAASAVSQ